MLHIHHITTLDLPALAPYRTMRRQMEHREEGIFVAEGEKVVRRLLESNFSVVSVLMPKKWLPSLEPLLEARSETVAVYLAEKPLLESLTGFSMYQGLLAIGKVPIQPSLDQILARTRSPRLFVAVDSLSSAQNLGALARNCAAFGVHVLITSETCTSPFLRRAVRSSMGAIFQLPVVELGSGQTRDHGSRITLHSRQSATLAEALRHLRSNGIHCVAAHPHATARTLPQADLTGDCCVLFGSEGYGISEASLKECDEVAAIPMAPNIDSLNVAAAAAVFLYEAFRQRSNFTH